jgi:LPXTG-site transpeptidase (sortase) family protein
VTAESSRHLARWFERLFCGVGLALLVWCVFAFTEGALFQSAESATLDRMLGPQVANASSASSRAANGKPRLIGRLEIPRVHMSVMVVDGDDEKTLRVAAGHLSDTPLPWELGNSAIAGHRDTFFRPLAQVRVTDLVRVVTSQGNFQYQVSKILIVEPDDVSVLAKTPDSSSSLTLVTCYPFAYVGHAPKRYIVQAKPAKS